MPSLEGLHKNKWFDNMSMGQKKIVIARLRNEREIRKRVAREESELKLCVQDVEDFLNIPKDAGDLFGIPNWN